MSASQGGIYSVLDDERINGRADFFRGLGRGIDGSWATSVGTLVPSDSEIENYNWLGTVPQLNVWEGEALFQQLPNYSAALRNIEYQSGLRVQKADLRRDKTGQIRTRIGSLGMRAGTHWEKLVSDLIDGGESADSNTLEGNRDISGQAYDGKAFFATDHTYENSEFTTSQKNKLASGDFSSLDVGTPAQPTADEMADILVDLISHFWTLKDDQGEPTNGDARSFLIMSGTAAINAAILNAIGLDTLSSGASNPVRGFSQEMNVGLRATLNPRLSDKTDRVYIMRTDADIAPFILQDEVGVDVDEDDPGKKFKYIEVMADATRSAGYGLWQNALVGVMS